MHQNNICAHAHNVFHPNLFARCAITFFSLVEAFFHFDAVTNKQHHVNRTNKLVHLVHILNALVCSRVNSLVNKLIVNRRTILFMGSRMLYCVVTRIGNSYVKQLPLDGTVTSNFQCSFGTGNIVMYRDVHVILLFTQSFRFVFVIQMLN